MVLTVLRFGEPTGAGGSLQPMNAPHGDLIESTLGARKNASRPSVQPIAELNRRCTFRLSWPQMMWVIPWKLLGVVLVRIRSVTTSILHGSQLTCPVCPLTWVLLVVRLK